MIVRRGNEVWHDMPDVGFCIRPPAVILLDPKYPHNVGAAVRACSCYEVRQLVITGDRVQIADTVERLPREERMRGYADVTLVKHDRPFDILSAESTPVCVEFDDSSEDLVWFEHPSYPVYVFGPEDGGVNKSARGLCERFVKIPTKHCLNLATALCTVLYDRHAKFERH